MKLTNRFFTAFSPILLMYSSFAMAAPQASVRMAFPPNNLNQFDTGRVENIDEAIFNKMIDQIQAMFAPIVAKHGGKLQIVKNWKDSTVNAFAQQLGSVWQVQMFGGLARRSEITQDGFAMVMCHELGHHLGGYTFTSNTDWAANEGNADYFATEACARAIWSAPSPANHNAQRVVPRTGQQACDTAWESQNDRARCYRTLNAGLSLANLLAAIGNEKQPSLDTPDTSQVTVTFNAHPKAQCRLDTYFHGALCAKTFDFDKIPGRNNPKGQISVDAEIDASKYSCMQSQGAQFGYRPLCWFKPLIKANRPRPLEEMNSESILN